MRTKNMIKCFTEGPKAVAKSSMCSETTIAIPDADINNKCIYIYLMHLRLTPTSLLYCLS